MMRKFYLLFLFGVVLVLNGCMDGTPTEEDGRKVLQEKKGDSCKILSFKKTNGKKEETYYTMYYESEVSYPEGLNAHCFNASILRDRDEYSSCLRLRASDVKEKGEKESLTGEIGFEKTENGWIVKRYSSWE